MPFTLVFPSNVHQFVNEGRDLDPALPTSDEPSSGNQLHGTQNVVPALVLSAVPPDVLSEIQYTLKNPRSMGYNRDFQMFRARLLSDGHDVGEVICKAAYGPGNRSFTGLRREAKLYQGRLAPLQDIYVPKFFGYFEGYTEDAETKVGCLVLDYVGEPLHDGVTWPAFPYKQRIFEAFLAIHKAGVESGSALTVPYTIRPRDGRLFIVGFSRGREHDCPKPVEMDLELGMMEPSMPILRCSELYDLGAELDGWIPHYVDYIGRNIPIEALLEGEEALIPLAITDSEDHARWGAKQACDWLKEFVESTGYDIPAALAKEEAAQEKLKDVRARYKASLIYIE